MTVQAFFDELSAQWKRQRQETQMTLGELIAALEAMPAGAEVANLREAHSYRGYYSDLAFERDLGTRPASKLLSECKAALGNTFCGYKGGDYVMDAETPVWVAYYGSCGLKLISVGPQGQIEIQEEDQS